MLFVKYVYKSFEEKKITKLLTPLPFLPPLLSYLRSQQATVAGFIDDLITLGRNFVKCERNIKLILTLLDSLRVFGSPK